MDFTLTEAIRKLIAIEKAGLLPELQREMAHTRRHRPKSPFDESPYLVLDVDYIARITRSLTGDSLGWCRKHAVEALYPTQRQEAFRLIDEFHQQLTPKSRRAL